jgi:hypothetical protein
MGVEELNIKLHVRSEDEASRRVRNTTWTFKDKKILHKLWERRLKGEATADLAAEIGIKSAGLRQRWRDLGYDPDSVRRQEEAQEVSQRDKQVYLMRVGEGLTFAECCLRLDMKPTHSNKTKLRNRLLKWCEQNEVPYPGRQSVDDRNEQVYRMRLEGKSYYAIANELGLETIPSVRRTLCSSLKYYCEKKGLGFPKRKRTE